MKVTVIKKTNGKVKTDAGLPRLVDEPPVLPRTEHAAGVFTPEGR